MTTVLFSVGFTLGLYALALFGGRLEPQRTGVKRRHRG